MRRAADRGRRMVILVLSAVALLGPIQAQAPVGIGHTNWPMYHHDPQHTGQSPFVGIVTAPTRRWSRSLAGQASGAVASGMSTAADGAVYVGVFSRLYALDPRDGTTRWVTERIQSLSNSTPAVATDGRLYWGLGTAFEVISSTGQIIGGASELSSNQWWVSSPVIGADGTVYVNHDGLWAFTADGNIRWMHPFDSWVAQASPALGQDGTIYTSSGFGEDIFYAFAPDGTIKWKGSIPSIDGSPSVGSDGTIYVPSSSARLAAYAPDGTLKWVYITNETAAGDSTIIGSPTIGSDGSIYFGAGMGADTAQVPGHLYALTQNGALKWKIALPSALAGAVVLDRAKHLYGCDRKGACYGFNADGTLLWKYIVVPDIPISTTPLVVGDHSIWVLDPLGTLYGLTDSQPTIYLSSMLR